MIFTFMLLCLKITEAYRQLKTSSFISFSRFLIFYFKLLLHSGKHVRMFVFIHFIRNFNLLSMFANKSAILNLNFTLGAKFERQLSGWQSQYLYFCSIFRQYFFYVDVPFNSTNHFFSFIYIHWFSVFI